MTVTLSSCGNPDYGQDTNKGVSPKRKVRVASLEEASEACLEYINLYSLGGGNWSGGMVEQGGKQVARISYNGRAQPV